MRSVVSRFSPTRERDTLLYFVYGNSSNQDQPYLCSFYGLEFAASFQTILVGLLVV